MLYYCISACSPLAASPLRLDSSGLLWTPHRPQHRNRELHEARGRPCTARFLFSISISILQYCKFASLRLAIPRNAYQPSLHKRTIAIHVSLYFISLCTILYLKLKLSNCQRSTLNDHTQRLHVTLPARIADSRSTSSRQEQETAN